MRDGLSALLRTLRKPSSSHHVWLRRSYIWLSTGMGLFPRTNADRSNRIRPPPPLASAARPVLPRPAAHPRSTASPRLRLGLVVRLGAASPTWASSHSESVTAQPRLWLTTS